MLRSHLEADEIQQAVAFAKNYESLIYFAHSLEILLHTTVESEATTESDDGSVEILPRVIEFLDYFEAALDVVVGCARKTEMVRWKHLFNIVGNPKTLFQVKYRVASLCTVLNLSAFVQKCLALNKLKTAASYLLVLHNMEQLDDDKDAVILLRRAIDQEDWQLCREVIRFLHSIDENGSALREALLETNLVSQLENGVSHSQMSPS